MELGFIELPVLPESPVGTPGLAGVVKVAAHASGEEVKGLSRRPTTPFTMPRYEPLSPGSSDGLGEARLKVWLARLQMEAQEKAESRQAQLTLEIRRVEIKADKAVHLRRLEP